MGVTTVNIRQCLFALILVELRGLLLAELQPFKPVRPSSRGLGELPNLSVYVPQRLTDAPKPSAAEPIALPPRDYQPTKAEKEQEFDMPGATLATVRRVFFQRVRVREEKPETE